jgi:hypothetical protein
VEKIGVPGESHWPFASHWQVYHIMLYRVHLNWAGLELIAFVMIGTDCTGSRKSNYHTITTTKAPAILAKTITMYKVPYRGDLMSVYQSVVITFLPKFIHAVLSVKSKFMQKCWRVVFWLKMFYNHADCARPFDTLCHFHHILLGLYVLSEKAKLYCNILGWVQCRIYHCA